MTKHRRFFLVLTLTAFLLVASGCTTSRWIPINEELEREGSGLQKEAGQSINAYQLSDGTEVVFRGKVKLATQDSLSFWGLESVAGYAKSEEWASKTWIKVPSMTLALDAIGVLKIQEGDTVKTVLLAIPFVAAVIAGIALASSPIAQ